MLKSSPEMLMKRREFIMSAAASAAAPALLISCQRRPKSCAEKDLIDQLVCQLDQAIPSLLQSQEQNSAHQWFGGIRDSWGIHSPGATSHFIRSLTCALLSPQSTFYGDPLLLQRLLDAAHYLLAAQHEDGTIDLRSTNFHSTPDTAFAMEWICAAYGLLQKADAPTYAKLLGALQDFMLNAGEALSVGGIHTPNHRWVVSMALARLNALFPNEKYVNRIDEWLAEHIDIDADGQFTEKSAAIYSPLVDRCLITMARLLGRAELYEPARRNLEMTIYYVHPNGEVVTEASKRQDKYKFGDVAPYYYPYRYMALLDDDGRFAAMADWIAETALARLTRNVVYFMETPELAMSLPARVELPTNYEKYFHHSSLARFRRGEVSATVLAKNKTLFSFRKGDAILQAVRCASAFFGKGQFEGQELTCEDGVYIMHQKLEGPYYQPFPKNDIPDDGDWEKMDREKRPQSEVQVMEARVRITESAGAFDLQFDVSGTDGVPVAVELAFRHGGRLSGVERVAGIKDAWFLKSGEGVYRYHGADIHFGPGAHAHSWTQLRGAEKKLDAMSVYITGFTPFKWTLNIA